jgi:hypothetical protein
MTGSGVSWSRYPKPKQERIIVASEIVVNKKDLRVAA